MELLYFFAALGLIALGVIIYSLICIHKEKKQNRPS
jgi:hypothetical protein